MIIRNVCGRPVEVWPSSLWRHVKQPAGDVDGDAVVKDDDGDDAEEDDGDNFHH